MIKIDFKELDRLDSDLMIANWKYNSKKREQTRQLIKFVKLYPLLKKYFNRIEEIKKNNLGNEEFKKIEKNIISILKCDLIQLEIFLIELSRTKTSYKKFFDSLTKNKIVGLKNEFFNLIQKTKNLIQDMAQLKGFEDNKLKKFTHVYNFRLGISTLKEFREKITEFEKYGLDEQIQELEGLKGKNAKIFGQSVKLDTEQEIEKSGSVDTVKALKLVKDNYIDDFIDFSNCNIFNMILKNNIKNNDDMIEYLESSNNIKMVFSDNSYNTGGYFNNDILIKIYKLSDELIQELDIIDEYITVIYAHRYGDIRGNYTSPTILSHLEQYDILHILTCFSKDIYFSIDNQKYLATFRGFSDEVLIYTVLDNGLLEGFGVYYGDIEDIKQYVIDNL